MLEKIKTNIKSILFSRQFKMFILLGLFSFVILSFGIDTTFADDQVKDAGVKSDQANLANDLLGFLQYIAGMAGGLIGGLTALLSILLNPSWVNGTLFDMSEYIRMAWVFVSNVVYLIFAGLLIAISFANIIGKGTGDFELKTALPKFVVGLLIVPFSWFIVQFVISMASILAVSVYAWPIESFSDKLSSTNESIEWCSNRTMNLQGKLNEDNTSGSNTTINTDKEGFFYCSDTTVGKKTIKEILNPEKGNIGSIIALYSFGVMDVGSLDKFSKDHVKDITDIFSLSAKVLFDIVFIFVYLVLLAALFIAMFARVIVLWIFMIISPLFGLLYFLGKGKVKEFDKIGFKDFLSLAMVPVYVSAALSFGLMFLLIIGEGGKDNGYQPEGWEVAALASGDRTYNLGITTLVIKGIQSDSTNENGFLFKIAGGAMGTLGYLMLKIFGLAFLWMAVIAALKQSSITSKLVEPFETFGREVGKFAMESPKFIPIPGTSKLNGGNGNLTAGSLGSFGSQSMRILGNRGSSDGSNLANKMFGGEEGKAITSELKKIREETNSGKKIDLLRDLLTKFEEQKSFLEKATIANELAATGKFSDKAIQDIRDSKDPEEYAEAISKANNELGDGKLLGEKNTTKKRSKEIMGSKPSGSSSEESSKTSSDFDFKVNEDSNMSVNQKAMKYLNQMVDKNVKLTLEQVKTDLVSNGEKFAEEVAKEMETISNSVTTETKLQGYIIDKEEVKGENTDAETLTDLEAGAGEKLGSTNQGKNIGENVASSLPRTQDNPTSSVITNLVVDPIKPLGVPGTESKTKGPEEIS